MYCLESNFAPVCDKKENALYKKVQTPSNIRRFIIYFSSLESAPKVPNNSISSIWENI